MVEQSLPSERPEQSSIEVEFTIELDDVSVDQPRLRNAVQLIAETEGVASGRIGIVVLDDAAIQKLNRQYLDHDYPTDVISFPLASRPGHLEGEIAVSIETARSQAGRFGWSAEDELLLYVVHGALHLAGYDDTTPPAAAEMRERERAILARFGLKPSYNGTGPASAEVEETL